jgi:aminoglycoside phosphotransferase (APT) family kinase protein
VHFDLHSSNIMVQDGELVIIDMGDFSIGSNFFDIGLIYMIYGVPELGMCQLATKIDAARGVEFWESFVAHYFAGRPPEEREFFDANRYFLASLRIVCAISYLPHIRDELIRLVKEVLLPRIALEAR